MMAYGVCRSIRDRNGKRLFIPEGTGKAVVAIAEMCFIALRESCGTENKLVVRPTTIEEQRAVRPESNAVKVANTEARNASFKHHIAGTQVSTLRKLKLPLAISID